MRSKLPFPIHNNELIEQALNREAVRITVGKPESVNTAGALGVQVGGSHYKEMKIQPFEFSIANNLNAIQHTAIKYIVRKKGDRDKRLEDIDKAIHTLQIYKEMIERGEAF
jgi:hypothetical protein